MQITRRAFIAAMGIALVGVSGCSSGKQEKNVPDGMSEAAFDLGTEVYDLAGEFLEDKTGPETAGAKVQTAIDNRAKKIDANNNKGDQRVLNLSAMIQMEFSMQGDDASGSVIKQYRDGLGYVLETGEYPDDLKSMDI
ncbi:hypothetical protein [Olsenella sp. HMSC062G07]|uniref:hypothetical protein n=1 Tax=Olsenella sp. HMSC062G07 TaxID=1739330 RepID=UPI0008A1EE7A|nr:hypothetical protein [Olsenella sp. HMSC062G07]OFK22892.1 hypothetical protein HMPREF2826_00740 [Olsenella sp. HMSC062G07]